MMLSRFLAIASGICPGRVLPYFVLAFLFTLAPIGQAQTAPKKKGAKPPSTAELAPEPAPEPAPAAPADQKPEKSVDKAATSAASEIPTEERGTDTREKPGQRYYFPGLRYRVTAIPQFLVNLFVNEGATFVSHTVGAELDMRKDGQSTIPWIAYQSFGFGDTLFEQKGADHPASDPSNWSVVNSGLSALFLGLDELWSVPLDESHHFDFEYGFGVGIGIVFGSLQNNWVIQNANGPLHSANNGNWSECVVVIPKTSCDPGQHNGADPAHPKINGYTEPNWFNGGGVPVVFPHVSFPQLGLRYKPVKQFEVRLGVGFSLTGFWLGVSGNYGLEKTPSQ
jgi:hypothetical protein